MSSLSNPDIRSLSADEIDNVNGGIGFLAGVAAVGAIASPVVLAGSVAYLVARESGRDKAKRDNQLGVCRVPNT